MSGPTPREAVEKLRHHFADHHKRLPRPTMKGLTLGILIGDLSSGDCTITKSRIDAAEDMKKKIDGLFDKYHLRHEIRVRNNLVHINVSFDSWDHVVLFIELCDLWLLPLEEN